LAEIEQFGYGWFVMEFHIPYFALRERLMTKKASDARGLRNSHDMPERKGGSAAKLVYHESQISVLLFGPDEWFWTTYCFVDTYFGSEYTNEEYRNTSPAPADAPSGGATSVDKPVWNPREYFLLILSRRMEQVSKEWSKLVAELNERLGAYVSLSSNIEFRVDTGRRRNTLRTSLSGVSRTMLRSQAP
jgi:hypothetical protein